MTVGSGMSATPRPLTHYALLSLGVAVLTFFLKLAAWRLTGSVGLLSDALESLANVAAALIAFASLSVAARPADEDHAYGHSKVEYFAGACEGGFILLAAAGIGWNAVDRLLHPQPLEGIGIGLAVSALASLILLATARVLFRAARTRGSVALEADAHHLMTDVWTSVAVIIAVALVHFTGWLWLDPVIGLLLAMHIIVTGVKLMRDAMLGLIDTALPPAELAAVKRLLDEAASRGIQWHALRTRQAGMRRFLSVHLLMPGDWTIARGHEVAEEIEQALIAVVPRLTAVTHLEPAECPSSWNDTGLDRAPQA
jgi:cation diffusion facilitator family transporter